MLVELRANENLTPSMDGCTQVIGVNAMMSAFHHFTYSALDGKCAT